MKKLFASVLFLLTSLSAHAVDFEVSAGSTRFQRPENGIWWQNPFENTIDNQSQSYSIGVTDKLESGLRWRASYVRLGNVATNAQATPADSQYNGVDGCVGTCPAMNTFRTEGSVRGFSLTVAPEMQIGAEVSAFVEGGVFIYLPKFYAEVTQCRTCAITWRNEYREGWQANLQLGAGIEYKKTQLVFTVYKIDTPTPDENATTNFRSLAYNIALRQRF